MDQILKGLYQLKHSTAEPSVRQSPAASLRASLLLRFHTFLYVLQKTLIITVFSHTFVASALLYRILRKAIILSYS